ncbi:hypothetical protein V5F40_21925 [Xanthobacter sp. DSM 14520]|uniref:hypothetical protein n=1 Tax=Xanthobacter TaxID=279 RepID=UPI00372C80E7
MDDTILARALHLLAIVHWIGGVSFVTLVILPLARRAGTAGVDLFERIEHRFAAQVRISIPMAGATGFWMTHRLNLWDRFADPAFWWMTAMVAVWTLFMAVVFVVEPLLGRRIAAAAHAAPEVLLGRALKLHLILLLVSALTILGAGAGGHGLLFF